MRKDRSIRIRQTLLTFLLPGVILIISFLTYLFNPLAYEVQTGSAALRLSTGVDATRLSPARQTKLDTITIVKLTGTPYQMGYQHGQLLSSEICAMIGLVQNECGLRGGPTGFLQRIRLYLRAKKLYTAMPAEFREEMQGIADGAGVYQKEILLLNVYDEIYHLASGTGLALSGKYTQDGELLFGQNLDFTIAKGLWNRQIVFQYTPEKGYSWVTVNWPGSIGVYTGMNNTGLTIGFTGSISVPKNDSLRKNAAPSEPVEFSQNMGSAKAIGVSKSDDNSGKIGESSSEPGIMAGLLARKILETCESIAEVRQQISASRTSGASNILVMSKKDDKAVVFELTKENVNLHIAENVLAISNHFDSANPAKFPSDAALQFSKFKKHRVELLADSYYHQQLPIGYAEMIDILDDREKMGGVNLTVGNPSNVQSVVYLPKKSELWIGINDVAPAASGPFSGFKFAPNKVESLKYLGRTTVHDTYLRSQIWFHRDDVSFWTDAKIREVLYRYRERNSEYIYYLHQKAELYLETGHYSTAIKLYQELLDQVDKESAKMRDTWTISYKYQLQFDLARAYYFSDQPVEASDILEVLTKKADLPDYLREQVRECLRKVRKLRAFDGKIYG